MRLPQNINPLEFDRTFRTQPKIWLQAAYEILSEHNIPVESLETFKDGSNLLAANKEFVVKIFPHFHLHQWESERRVLHRLWVQGLSLPIPKLIANGKRSDGWTYIIMSRLSGITLESIWPLCTQSKKIDLLQSIGKLMAHVHAIPVGELHDLEPQWQQFLEKQRLNYMERHSNLSMPNWFLDEAKVFIDKQYPILPSHTPTILTGEYTPFNLLVDGAPGDWRITGMIDFGDAMVGFHEYDFLGPILFLCEGNSALLSGLFSGYGNSQSYDENMRKRLLLLAILHRYSNLKSQIRIDSWESRVKKISDLEDLIFPHLIN